MNIGIPTEKDWGNYKSDLDIFHAYKIFAGKTNSEAVNEFKKNVINRCDDLRWMPLVPFQFYLLAYRDYILAGNFDIFDKADAVSCFIGLVKEVLINKSEFISPLIEELMPTLKHIAENQNFYEADIDIYGDFNNELKEIEALIAKK